MLKLKIAILALTLGAVLYVQFCMDIHEIMQKMGVNEPSAPLPAPATPTP